MFRRLVVPAFLIVLLLQGVAPSYDCTCCPDEMSVSAECTGVCPSVAALPAAGFALAEVRSTQHPFAVPQGTPGPAYLPLTPPPIS